MMQPTYENLQTDVNYLKEITSDNQKSIDLIRIEISEFEKIENDFFMS